MFVKNLKSTDGMEYQKGIADAFGSGIKATFITFLSEYETLGEDQKVTTNSTYLRVKNKPLRQRINSGYVWI